ncbi:MAG: PqqD family protein [Bacteroidaceae bacterium]|nr:PqqD family protein [Bacteroidaceae bacterium]
MKIKKGFVLRDVCGEKVIVGESVETINFNHLISLNATAAWLWCKAEEQVDFTVDSLVEALCGTYDVERERATADVTRILSQWKEIGVIE